ncbi:MAG TPA: class E sortase [Gaiellaceae bacterium]
MQLTTCTRAACTAVATVLAVLVCALLPAPASATPAGAGARLIIPRLKLDDPVGSQLSQGPAFYPSSARPGQPDTVAIAGHRTTHTHPFWSLNLLRRGDAIKVVWHGRPHTYRVTSTRVVAPTDWSLVRSRGYERLILSTCTPRFSARERLIVTALPAKS